MDPKKIEQAALEAMRRYRMATGSDDLPHLIAKAVAAAIAEYDRQKNA